MIRIAITAAAFNAVSARLPLGTVSFEAARGRDDLPRGGNRRAQTPAPREFGAQPDSPTGESRESKFTPRTSHTEVEDLRQSVHSSRPWPLNELKRLIVR